MQFLLSEKINLGISQKFFFLIIHVGFKLSKISIFKTNTKKEII